MLRGLTDVVVKPELVAFTEQVHADPVEPLVLGDHPYRFSEKRIGEMPFVSHVLQVLDEVSAVHCIHSELWGSARRSAGPTELPAEDDPNGASRSREPAPLRTRGFRGPDLGVRTVEKPGRSVNESGRSRLEADVPLPGLRRREVAVRALRSIVESRRSTAG